MTLRHPVGPGHVLSAEHRNVAVIPPFSTSLCRTSLYSPSIMEERTGIPAATAAVSGNGVPVEFIQIGEFRLDRSTGELSNGTGTIMLQPSSLGVLNHLVKNVGRVVSADELIEAVWPHRIIGDDAVHRRIADIRKQLGDDARRPRYVETLPRRGYRLIASVTDEKISAPRATFRDRALIVAVSVAVSVGLILLLQLHREMEQQARTKRIADLIEQGDSFGTYLEIQHYPDAALDPALRVLSDKVLKTGRLESDPAGADVWFRWRSGGPWHHVGQTPLEGEFPVGIFSIRLEKPGFARRTIIEANPGLAFNNMLVEPLYRLHLLPAEAADETTNFVQGGNYPAPFIMSRERYALDNFLIDRFEVSNVQFKTFVDAGGYQNPSYWTDYPHTEFEAPEKHFLDSTGYPGPASWEFGSFPTGAENLPVSGVSWYEAQAYSRWAGRPLPTALDWARATLSPVEWDSPIAPLVVEHANIRGEGLLPVGASGFLSASGAADLVGNVREWTSSTTHELPILIGGGYDSPRVQYAFPIPTDALDRSLLNGFRLVTYLGERNALLTTALDWQFSGDVVYEPMSDETFAGISELFTYEPGAVDREDARLISTTDEGDWERRILELPSIAPDDTLPVHLFVPENVKPPFQAVIFVPPSDSFGPTITTADIDLRNYFLDVVVRSGRALVWPIYFGTHERFDHGWSLDDNAFLDSAARNNRLRRDEIGRVIDYLEADPEFNADSIGLIARGFGATFVVPSMLAMESRIKAVVLWNPLYPHGKIQRPVINPATYWPRVRQPVLAAAGRDHAFANRSADPKLLMDLIGTDSKQKQLKIYDGPHWPLPRRELLMDTIDWLDRHLGSPET